MDKLKKGSMLSIALSEAEVKKYLCKDISIAAVNSPNSCVVSGTNEAINRIKDDLSQAGIFVKALKTSHAFHSMMMEPILDEFKETVRNISLHEPQILYISNVTGKYITAEEVKNPEYWASHLRNTVRYSDGFTELLNQEDRIYLEVGPGSTLSILGMQNSLGKNIPFVQFLSDGKVKQDAQESVLEGLGQLWINGKDIDWEKLHTDEKRRRVSLPTYSFERKRFWSVVDEFNAKNLHLSNNQMLEVKQAVKDWFYVPRWKKTELPTSESYPTVNTVKQKYLVFKDTVGLANQIISILESQGHEVITVEAGKGYKKNKDNQYEIKSDNKEDYKILFESLNEQGNLPEIVIHLWGVNKAEEKQEEYNYPVIEHALKLGYYSMLSLAQAYGELNYIQDLRVFVVTNNMQQVIGGDLNSPEKATVLGPVKVIPQEYSNIKCKSIDIDLNAFNISDYIEPITAELNGIGKDPIIAYRNGARYVEYFEKVLLNDENTGKERLKEKGVYLITGGLGSLGLVLAEHLAEKVHARLVLIGRSEFPEKDLWEQWIEKHGSEDRISKKIIRLQKIETNGGEVLVCQGDAASESEMKEVVERAEKMFGQINGVIHAAGVLNTKTLRLVKETYISTSEEQFKPKIYGTLVLDNIFKNKPIDLKILMSSLSTVLGGLGHVAYASANRFMDAYAYYNTNRQNWLSITWDVWENSVGSISSLMKYAIMFEEGMEAFDLILNNENHYQIVISTGELQERINNWLNLEKKTDNSKQEKKVEEKKREKINIREWKELENELVKIFKETLGVKNISKNDNFFEIGATSLTLIQINERIKHELKLNIAIEKFFTYSNIYQLINYLKENSTYRANYKNTEKKNAITSHSKDIAVIGLSGRFPGAKNISEYWENIKNGIETISDFSKEELLESGISRDELNSEYYVKRKGIVQGIEEFDAETFGYNDNEAELMDPQMRIFHECAWEALEDAGYNSQVFKGKIGLYGGGTKHAYWEFMCMSKNSLNPAALFEAATLTDKDHICPKVAYNL
ncbi:beta-ketoacyl reductase, partial [Parabacteroides merdae]|uniref:beta-ketoacyl reductase n=1 Tax=Parabacteroides merdae TaxID=46503 RepID=UPI0035BBF988